MEVRANENSADGQLHPVIAQQQQQMRWTPPDLPAGQPMSGLKVNSSGTEVPFRTKDSSRNVTWYNCGPTVYDSAHVGHARNYLTFDIIRRILEEYFEYNVFYVMNITDVDDKIVNRARRIHLLDLYRKSSHDYSSLLHAGLQPVSFSEVTEEKPALPVMRVFTLCESSRYASLHVMRVFTVMRVFRITTNIVLRVATEE